MREANLGITRSCAICGKNFWCDDGDYFCSGSCTDEYEKILEEEKHPGYGEED